MWYTVVRLNELEGIGDLDATTHSFAEHTAVRLNQQLPARGRILPKDARGVVVGLYPDGKGYVVEFHSPIHIVANVEASFLSNG